MHRQNTYNDLCVLFYSYPASFRGKELGMNVITTTATIITIIIKIIIIIITVLYFFNLTLVGLMQLPGLY